MSHIAIDTGYEKYAKDAGDMHGHMTCLRDYSARCQSVTEFGVHDCTSTWALIAGHPKKLTSYDIGSTSHPYAGEVGAIESRLIEVKTAAQDSGTEFQFILGDSATVDIEETDLLLIDSCHTYDHLTKELARHPGNVRKFILLHDTTIFANEDQYSATGTRGLWPAIEEFLAAHPEWRIKERFTHCYGLTVLERVHTAPPLLGRRKHGAVLDDAWPSAASDSAEKLHLPSVTLFCADCVDVDRAVRAIEKCKSVCRFGDVKFLTSLPTDYPHIHIDPLQSLTHYSVFMLKKCHEFIDTKHMLVCQHDAWIINPETWDPAWLAFDYLGPLFVQCPMVGSGGFTLRSKRLMEHVSNVTPRWDGSLEDAEHVQSQVGVYEDGAVSGICASSPDFVLAPVAAANRFAQGGNPDPAHHFDKPFGFHREGRIGLTSPLLT